jgi:hypothetical protein
MVNQWLNSQAVILRGRATVPPDWRPLLIHLLRRIPSRLRF